MCGFPAMVWLVRLGDLTTDCSGASRQRRSLRSHCLPVGAEGSCQVAKGWTLSMKLREHRLRRWKRPCSDRSGECQQLRLVRLVGMNTMWSHLSDASRRRGRQRGEALMEQRPQRGTNRGRSGMVARSTDGHKTNASLGAEHLERVGMEML